ncbi:MAG: aminopeptidase P family protein, partial [Acidobacteria bacterium]|nr:aminopeptidase P family protein [Acidobacteriota bacterium]
MKLQRLFVLLAIFTAPVILAEAPRQGRVIDDTPAVLEYRDRLEPVNRILRNRLDTLLPQLMRETGIDMWLVINREYNEDPVYLTLVPEPAFAARRTTMLVIHDPGAGKPLERLTVSRYPQEGFYESAWEGGSDEEQWAQLAAIIRDRNPKRVGIDVSEHWAFADGLSHGLHQQLTTALGPSLSQRLVSAENLVLRWLETRTDEELAFYPHTVALARSVISEAFSSKVITPGVTTTDDVAWFIRQRYADLNLPIWFMPYVNVQRRGVTFERDDPFFGKSSVVIMPGDVLHTDVGITYLRLNTDTQEMGYVLRPSESDVPEGLKRALEVGNRWQDLLTTAFVSGRSGNEILEKAKLDSEKEGILGSIYTHPIGYYGHGPGPTIGMWDNQGRTPVRGDWKLYPNTAYAIEGSVKVPV